jgi:HSP20 family molecular chaperone IbpA
MALIVTGVKSYKMKGVIMLRPFFEEEKDFFEHWFAQHPCSHLSTDVYEDKKGNVVVEMHVPGIDQDEISIEAIGTNVLKVSGTQKHSAEKKDANFHKKEIQCGSFEELVTIPEHVDPLHASAHLESGVLTITLPIKKETKNSNTKIAIS